MIDDSERLIGQQLRRLDRAEGVDVMYLIAPALRKLIEDPFLAPELDDLLRDADRAVSEFFDTLGTATRVVGRAAVKLFNTPAGGADPKATHRMAIVEAVGDRRIQIAMDRRSRVWSDPISMAAKVIEERLEETRTAPPLDESLRIMRDVRQVQHAVRAAIAVIGVQLSQPAFGYVRLLGAAMRVPEKQPSIEAPFGAREGGSSEQVTEMIVVRELLAGGDLIDLLTAPDWVARGGARLLEVTQDLKLDFVELLEELLFRLGGVRSRRALIDRYVARCERYDRDRLRTLAEGESAKAESLLRDDLARYLFDSGLDPLTETSLTTTRSDLLELSAIPVLVEAKQYTTGQRDGLLKQIRKAYWQTVDTAAELRPRNAQEAFVVVYRRSGSRLVLPEDPVRLGETNYFFRLVDLADSAQTGSRATEPVIEVTAQDISDVAVPERSEDEL